MNQALPNEAAIRERIETYLDPYLGRTLGEAKAVRAVEVRPDGVRVELLLGFPCADYGAELGAALQAHARQALGGAGLTVAVSAQIVAHAVQRTLRPLENV